MRPTTIKSDKKKWHFNESHVFIYLFVFSFFIILITSITIEYYCPSDGIPNTCTHIYVHICIYDYNTYDHRH